MNSSVTRIITISLLLHAIFILGCSQTRNQLNSNASPPELIVKLLPTEFGVKQISQSQSYSHFPEGTDKVMMAIQLLRADSSDQISYRLYGQDNLIVDDTIAIMVDDLWKIRYGDFMVDIMHGHSYQNGVESQDFASTPLSVSVASGSKSVYVIKSVRSQQQKIFRSGEYFIEVLWNDKILTKIPFDIVQ